MFERVDAERASRFWEDSPHASVYTHPGVLEALAGEVHWWLCRKGAEPVCLWPVAPEWARRAQRVPWTMYVGPMWSTRAWQVPAHRWLATSQRAHLGLAERICRSYGAYLAQLPLGLSDVRPFEWAREDGTLAGTAVRPRYSAVIAAPARPESDIVAGWRSVRRQELRRASALQPRLRLDPSTAEVARLYSGVLDRQGATAPAGQLDSLPTLLEIARAGHGASFAMDVGGRLAYAGVLLHDRSATHLVLGAVDEEFRRSGVAALATLEAIRIAARKRAPSFDFDGANSPTRGDDKHSYGAEARLYFEIRREVEADAA